MFVLVFLFVVKNGSEVSPFLVFMCPSISAIHRKRMQNSLMPDWLESVSYAPIKNDSGAICGASQHALGRLAKRAKAKGKALADSATFYPSFYT